MKTIYVYGDGAVWKLSPADILDIARDKSWYSGQYPRGKKTSAHQSNRGVWHNLPAVLSAFGNQLSLLDTRKADLYHYADEDLLIEACEQAAGAARQAVAASPRRKPSSNDPGLTVAKLKLKRIGPGNYEHVNAATGTTWEIFHRTGEYRGENEWVYMRTDENAWSSSEGRAQDAYATKADAVEALVDRLRHRGA